MALRLPDSIRLFEGIDRDDLAAMLACAQAKATPFARGETVLAMGEEPRYIGVLLEGKLQINKEDIHGERVIVAALSPGDFFAEALCCAGVKESPVNVVANADSVVLLLEFDRVLYTCPSACAHHHQLLRNMLYILSTKNLMLQSRMDCLSKKMLRAKIISYLESFAPSKGRTIDIPLNREELADFLCVDRSALSHELSRMKADGLIDYRKNRFQLLRVD